MLARCPHLARHVIGRIRKVLRQEPAIVWDKIAGEIKALIAVVVIGLEIYVIKRPDGIDAKE